MTRESRIATCQVRECSGSQSQQGRLCHSMRLSSHVYISGHLLASQLYQYHISLRLTIMCVSNGLCGNAEISTQSQDNTL